MPLGLQCAAAAAAEMRAAADCTLSLAVYALWVRGVTYCFNKLPGSGGLKARRLELAVSFLLSTLSHSSSLCQLLNVLRGSPHLNGKTASILLSGLQRHTDGL